MRKLLLLALVVSTSSLANSTIVILNNDRVPGSGQGGTIGGTAPNLTFTSPDYAFVTADLNGTLILSGSGNAANNGAFRVTAVASNVITFTNANPGAAAETFTGNWQFGEGFNDPMPIAPVGGNPGTTVGAQRLNAFQYAADRWGQVLDSAVPVLIRANFNAQTCTPTQAVLGSAGTTSVFRDFPGAKVSGTWYSASLANKLAGEDLLPPGPGADGAEISSTFNSSLNGNPGCLGGGTWYYGFDHAEGPNQTDLLPVLMHEFGHGLGMQSFVNKTSAVGTLLAGFPDMYLNFMFDNQVNRYWRDMTDAERATSMKNGRRVVWNGPHLLGASRSLVAPGTAYFQIGTPSTVAGRYLVGEASFGNRLTDTPLAGVLVEANDGVGTLNDACEALPAASLTGQVALTIRGGCTFNIKALNVQNAGAIAMVVADNAAGSPPAGLGGADPLVTIPSVRIMQSDGNAIRAQLTAGATLNVTLGLDMTQLSGADQSDRLMLYTPDPIASGSNVSHFDTSVSPNTLMEPAINGDLTTDVGLTLPLFRDIGWDADSDNDLVVDGQDNCTIVANSDQLDTDGDTVGDACDDDDDSDTVADVRDNCPLVQNPDQLDLDADLSGDDCDADDDGDTVDDAADNCPRAANTDQADRDTDGVGDACVDVDSDGVADAADNCPDAANADQRDTDGDTDGDTCDVDDDNDGFVDGADNCPLVANDQADLDQDAEGDSCENDTDGDTVPNAEDNCPVAVNADQLDLDLDAQGDVCDLDDDADDRADTNDNCVRVANADQQNGDGDLLGDVCDSDDDNDGVDDGADNCPVTGNADQNDADLDGRGNACDADDDGDAVSDGSDNCPVVRNSDQADAESDGEGDVCDQDDDNDGEVDGSDNCPRDANGDQLDTDLDAAGNVCDSDDDNDGVLDTHDNCALTSNLGQTDTDGDASGDACDADDDNDTIADATDNCDTDANPDQLDTNADGVGDVCGADDDADGVVDAGDNCPLTANPDQLDTDGDRLGNVCDPDDDNDADLDGADNCPLVANPDQKDEDKDGIGDLCEPPKPAGCSAVGGNPSFTLLLVGMVALGLMRRRRFQS